MWYDGCVNENYLHREDNVMKISERDKVFREIIEKIIGGTYYYTLNHAMKDLSVCEENYEYLKELLNDKRNRINAAYVLQDRYIPEKAQELFTLFSASDTLI